MINALETKELQDWNNLVLKHWDHWQYYKDMINFSLQKSANSPLTRFFYPFLYQERILKRIFAENMQILGDLTNEEIWQFETITQKMLLAPTYNYFRRPEGGLMGFYHISTYLTAILVGVEAYRARRPRRWWFWAPIVFFVGMTGMLQRFNMLELASIVNITEWAIEKRKAEVWKAQKFLQLPPMNSYCHLEGQMISVVFEEKMLDIKHLQK